MLRNFGWAAGLTVVAVVVAAVFGGVQTALVVLLLGVLEISLSFDNAVVNAKVLNRMHPVWQRLFLTVGILIAVFGMRLLLPIVIVAVTSHIGVGQVVDLALNDATEYGRRLAESQSAIYAFGGTFLLMIFLDFVFDPEREILWLTPVESALQKIGKLDQLSVLLALGGIYLMSRLAEDGQVVTVLLAGIAGLVTYLAVNGLDSLFEASMEAREDDGEAPAPGGKMTMSLFRAGIFTFVYLEVLDASFSFDGVIGAFAISNEVLVIALGLGIGAFWIRSLTIYLVRAGTLSEYVYLEHGAHWAIGVLAAIMLFSVKYHVNEVITGLVGVGFILLALGSSVRERRREVDVDDADKVLGGAPR
jgi:hypothetical protein